MRVGRRTVEYRTWGAMIERCEYEKADSFPDYGGRGITVCARWRHDFLAFLADMGFRPSPRHSIDRIDNDGDYTPDNCRWALPDEQVLHKRPRSTTRFVTHQGVTLSITEWGARLGVAECTIRARIKAGWPLGRALAEPGHPRGARAHAR